MHHIHDRLQEDGFPNCSALARELEVATKTVQRDLDFMRDRLGLPIEYDPERFGYRYTKPVGSFPMVHMSEGELVALFVAQKAMADYHGTPFQKPLEAAFRKLTEALTDRLSFTWTDLDAAISFRSIGASVEDLELFDHLSEAVMKSREVKFEYRKLKGRDWEPRKVRPYHLGCVEHQWYLFGFDLDRQDLRTFALPRIRKVFVTSERFTRPADFSLAKHLGGSFGVFSGKGKHEVKVRFDAFASRLVRERQWHPSQKIRELAEGKVELTLSLSSLEEVERWVLSWGAHATVLAPPALRKVVRSSLLKASAFYKP